MQTKDAIDHLSNELLKDTGYYYSWQSNIAMQFLDELDRRGYRFPEAHSISNEAAKNFLNLLISQTENREDKWTK